ncbi:MAG: cupredoxin domain-containing protein [Gemmatimonadaceae bacterium]
MRSSTILCFAAAMAFPAVAAGSQSLLDRSPNVSGDWVGASGTLYFHFVHRFAATSPPERKVSNVPTFLVAAGLPMRLLAGFNYSTNSTLAPRFPNEWELFARWQPLSQDRGAPVDIGGQVGYNNAADGIDAELSLAKKLGITRVIVAGRALSNPLESGDPRLALAGGATLRLGQFVALAGDVSSLLDRDSAERVAWSAGIHFAIPLTPHTVSLHATNSMITTLQGASRGSPDVRYGFEFTIPLTLRRYFGRRAKPSESVTDTAAAQAAAAPSELVQAVVVPESAAVAPPPSKIATTEPATTATSPSTTVRPPPPAPAPAPKPRTTAPAGKPVSPPAAQAARVVRTSIKNLSYLQPRLRVTVGTTIEWTNDDPLPHTVTAADKSFDSGLIDPGKKFRYTFTKAGTFSFFCVPHPFMKGTVEVRQP